MKYLSHTLLWLATWGMIAPQLSLAAVGNPAVDAPRSGAPARVVDVALNEHSVLSGQLVDAQGVGKHDCRVRILSDEQVIGEALTDYQGRFSISVPRGGVYTLSDGEASALVRVWTAQAAPPSAKASVLMVSDPELARGRLGRGGLDTLIGWAAIIGVTAAVIWAVTDSSDGS